jgi:hypothetical protein
VTFAKYNIFSISKNAHMFKVGIQDASRNAFQSAFLLENNKISK